jgi:mannose-1-phosphate guanylyltransferase
MSGEHVWSVVLAGGEGTRLRALTTAPCGTPVPKQYCSFQGGRTLLEDAIERASGVVDEARICAIVAQQHRQWWTQSLQHMRTENIIVQPRNKGTAIGVLYSLLSVIARDPLARVLLLPADHYVRDEAVLRQALGIALSRLDADDSKPVLLGLEPDEADPELGYVVPGARDPFGGLRRAVRREADAASGKRDHRERRTVEYVHHRRLRAEPSEHVHAALRAGRHGDAGHHEPRIERRATRLGRLGRAR